MHIQMAIKKKRKKASVAPEWQPTADLKSDAQRRCLKAAVELTRGNAKITKRKLSDRMQLSEAGSQPHLRALIKNNCIEAITETRDVVVGYRLTKLGEDTFEELVKLKRMPE